MVAQRCIELDEFGNPRSTNSTSSKFLPHFRDLPGKLYGTDNKEATSSASALGDHEKLSKFGRNRPNFDENAAENLAKLSRSWQIKDFRVWSGVENAQISYAAK